MCIFSGDVTDVSSTRIFARGDGASQFLVYQMEYEAAEELAMVLPLPVMTPSTDDAVRFISLEAYPDFFEDLNNGFPLTRALSYSGAVAASMSLEVHDVGNYEASYVPTLAAMSRLDPRFRLPASVWESLPEYSDYGFAVFKLKASASPQEVHPMAMRFPRRNWDSLYFPTFHIHDGESHAQAEYDHALYCQADGMEGHLTAWRRSHAIASDFVVTALTNGIVRPDSSVWRTGLYGMNTNSDSTVGHRAIFPQAV